MSSAPVAALDGVVAGTAEETADQVLIVVVAAGDLVVAGPALDVVVAVAAVDDVVPLAARSSSRCRPWP